MKHSATNDVTFHVELRHNEYTILQCASPVEVSVDVVARPACAHKHHAGTPAFTPPFNDIAVIDGIVWFIVSNALVRGFFCMCRILAFMLSQNRFTRIAYSGIWLSVQCHSHNPFLLDSVRVHHTYFNRQNSQTAIF